MSNINFNDYFTYDENSPSLLVNKVNRRGNPAGSPVKPGKTIKGYIRFSLKGKTYFAHRVIYEMHNGPIPDELEIDHLDNSRDNNRINNLEAVTHSVNMERIPRDRLYNPRDKASGLPPGISKHNTYGSYRARLKLNGKLYTKVSVCLETLKEWRVSMMRELILT